MEVHFSPDVQTKLEQMARETVRPSEELVEDAVIGGPPGDSPCFQFSYRLEGRQSGCVT